jgi:hypothetical protein
MNNGDPCPRHARRLAAVVQSERVLVGLPAAYRLSGGRAVSQTACMVRYLDLPSFRCALRLSAILLNSHRRPMVQGSPVNRVPSRIEHPVFFRGCSIQAMEGGRPHVLRLPLARSSRHRRTREDGYAPVEITPFQLLGKSRQVYGLARADGHLRVEDHDAHLRARREVARMHRLRGRDPEELPVPHCGVPHGRHPRSPGLIGGSERHVLVGVDDGPGDSPKVLLVGPLLLSVLPTCSYLATRDLMCVTFSGCFSLLVPFDGFWGLLRQG